MKTLTTLFLTAVSSVIMAQIPNACFDNWTSGNPDQWQTTNILQAGSVTQVSNTHGSCTSAVQLNSVTYGSIIAGGVAETWNGHTGYFVNAGNPVAVNGWYILNSVGGDELEVATLTRCSTGENGGEINTYSTSTTVYKQFSACLTYTVACTADSAEIFLELSNSRMHDTTHSGSYAIIDDLSFGSCSALGVDDIQNQVNLEAAYPNPASDFCNIIYSIPATSTVNVALYDLSGKKVMNILDNTNQTIGRYKIPVDVSKLANGVYAYTISVDGVPYTQKLVVAK